MAKMLILLVLFLTKTVVSNPVSNKTCEASENCRGVEAMGRLDITSDPFYDDNPKKEKSWEVLDYYKEGGTTLEGWDQDIYQPFYDEEYIDDYIAGENTSQVWDQDTSYDEEYHDDDNPQLEESWEAYVLKNKTKVNPEENDFWINLIIYIPMFVIICILVMVFFCVLCMCMRRKKARDHQRQLAQAKKNSMEYLEGLKKVHGSNPKMMQSINDIENDSGPLNFSTNPKDSKDNPSLDSIAKIKATNREKNDASMPEEDGKGVNVKAGKASDAVHQGPSDVTNGLSSIDAASPTSNTLVCEFFSDKPFSLESLERHTLSVHGTLEDQSPNNLEKFEIFSSSNSSVVTSSSASSTKTIQYSCRFNAKQGAVYLAARQSKAYPAPTPEHQKVLNTGIAMKQVKSESTLHFPPINASKSCYVIDIPDKPESRNSKKYKSARNRSKRTHQNGDDRCTKVRSVHGTIEQEHDIGGNEQEGPYKSMKNQTIYKSTHDIPGLFPTGQETWI